MHAAPTSSPGPYILRLSCPPAPRTPPPWRTTRCPPRAPAPTHAPAAQPWILGTRSRCPKECSVLAWCDAHHRVPCMSSCTSDHARSGCGLVSKGRRVVWCTSGSDSGPSLLRHPLSSSSSSADPARDGDASSGAAAGIAALRSRLRAAGRRCSCGAMQMSSWGSHGPGMGCGGIHVQCGWNPAAEGHGRAPG